jgi:predicted lipoprotein with Yx(FWY)xxD motif
VTIANTSLGDVMVDADGLTLYAFTKDADGTPTCNDKCAEAWPPVIVDSAELPAGLDANIFSVVERADGSFQLKAGKWPLYHFAGDGAPGDVNGQGSGGVWFVLDPAAKLIK